MHLCLITLEFTNKYNMLPFGFNYLVHKPGKKLTGKINLLETERCKEQLLDKIKNIKTIAFNSVVYSPQKENYRFHLSSPAGAMIKCNGLPVRLEARKFYNRMTLEKGFNSIGINYSFEKDSNLEIRFFMRKGFFSKPIPFYYCLLPGSTSSKLLFHCIRFLDHSKSLGFLLALIILLVKMPGILMTKVAQTGNNKLSGESRRPIFEFVLWVLAMFFAGIFLNNRLNIALPDIVLGLISLLVPLVLMKRSLPKITTVRFNLKSTVVFILIAIFVFSYITAISGKVIPLEPIGSGDLDAHMKMVYHFKIHHQFKLDEDRMIYPQTLHAFISIISDMIGTKPERVVTLMLALCLIGVFYLVYLLITYFFPGLHPVLFFLVFPLLNLEFIFDTIFRFYYFPPIVSIFFFLGVLLFFLEGRFMISSLLLAVSLVVYPYYTIIFSLTLFLLMLNRLATLEDSLLVKIARLLAYFFPAVLFMCLYVIIYIIYGFAQIQEGFASSVKFNPFSGFGPLASFMILFGISALLFYFKQNRSSLTGRCLILAFGSVVGFSLYYIPYFFWGKGTTYYLTKNMLYLIIVGMIFEIYALAWVLSWVRKTRLFLGISRLFGGAASALE
jgi:hypothetical protein